MRLRWTATALRDLEEIGDWIARDNSNAAEKVVSRILACVDLLTEQPQLGRPGRVSQTRELVVSETPYIVPYRLKDAEVEIVAVIHGARRWPQRFE